MALYKTHSKLNVFIALPILLGICVHLLQTEPKLLLLFASSFVYGTLYMNPDLDLANKIKLFSVRGILTLPFRLYSRIFRHRGISHSIFLGTFTRILFLLLLVFSTSYFILKMPFFHLDAYNYYKNNQVYFFYGFLGLFLADFFHILVDSLTPKRR